jgi:hypothetical protein
MATQYGVGQNHSLSGFLLDLATGTAYLATCNWQSVRVGSEGEWEEVAGKDGEIASFIVHGNYLEMSVEAVPQGASLSAAAATAKLPPRGTPFSATGFGAAHIPVGPFTTSGINTAAGSLGSVGADTNPWYLYSAELNATNTGKWTTTMTLRRYKGITATAAIT